MRLKPVTLHKPSGSPAKLLLQAPTATNPKTKAVSFKQLVTRFGVPPEKAKKLLGL